jgi:hypothetical protein
MFLTPALAWFLIALEFLAGAVIGVVVVALVYRSRFNLRLAVRGAVLAGVAFLFAAGVAGWADSHVYFYNEKRLDVSPAGENLWWRNRIAEHETGIEVVSSCGAALLAGLRFKKPFRA